MVVPIPLGISLWNKIPLGHPRSNHLFRTICVVAESTCNDVNEEVLLSLNVGKYGSGISRHPNQGGFESLLSLGILTVCQNSVLA